MSAQTQSKITIFCPAKVNLFLAVTGQRKDGYHELVSVVAPIDFGDHLWAEPGEPGQPDSLECDNPDLDVGESNLVLKASTAFRRHRDIPFGIHYRLVKRIPVGAGLGGGSSNAAAVLRALNSLVDEPLPESDLLAIGSELGSDVPLFLSNLPVIMRGRGERIEALSKKAVARLSGKRILVFKPEFPIETGWAYDRLAANPEFYASLSQSEDTLSQWLESDQPVEKLLFNSFQAPVFKKFLTYPALFSLIEKKGMTALLLSGSGSACFCLLDEKQSLATMTALIHEAWGEDVFMVESSLL